MLFRKRCLFVLCLCPLLMMLMRVWLGDLVNPVEYLLRELGRWTMILLLVTLSMSPLRQLSGKSEWLRYRRMLGLWTFCYATLHVLFWLSVDQGFDAGLIVKTLFTHPPIWLGLLSFLLLFLLALTSSQAWMQRLGKQWLRLHRLVYLAVLLGLWHHWWLTKRDLLQPELFALMVSLLLGYRLYIHIRKKMAAYR